MKKIDPMDSVKLRLYRDHISSDKFGYFKDLGKLGRDFEFLVIVDNSAMNFRYHREWKVKRGILLWVFGHIFNIKKKKDFLPTFHSRLLNYLVISFQRKSSNQFLLLH